MHRILPLIVFFLILVNINAQDNEQVIISPNFPLVITVPDDWVFTGVRGELVFEFLTENFTMQVYVSSQGVLEANGINPDDLDAAIKRYPFQPFPDGRRSLTAAGWAYETIAFEHEGVELLVRDYSSTGTPSTEMIRVLDTGMIVLARIDYDVVDFSEQYGITTVFNSIRMTEQGEYDCHLSDFGEVTVYQEADLNSPELESDSNTEVLQLIIAPESVWYSLSNGGFVNRDDIDAERLAESGCHHVPIGGQRVPVFDAETTELDEELYLIGGFKLNYPSTGGWHMIEDRPWTLSNNILEVDFNPQNIDILEAWQDTPDDAISTEDCMSQESYEENLLEGIRFIRLSIIDTCDTWITSGNYTVRLAVPRTDNTILEAETSPVYEHRPIGDTRIVERMLASLRRTEVGDIYCDVSTLEATPVYTEMSLDEAGSESLEAGTQAELQALGRDADDDWWVQLTSGAWLPFEAIDYDTSCEWLPRIFV